MIDWSDAARNGANGTTALPKLDARTTGIVAGTKVATSVGWVAVETIVVGSKVLTFDGGLQTVIAVTHHKLLADTADMATWPLHVPSGALGNRDDMMILPHQTVLIESDIAEEMTGDPFALLPAAALEGCHEITSRRPEGWVDVIQIHFESDEIIYANIGALFLCRAQTDLIFDIAPSVYDVLSIEQADDLVECLMEADTGQATSLSGAVLHAVA